MNKKYLKMIKSLSEGNGVSGFEKEIIEISKEFLNEGFYTKRDSLNNFIIKNPKSNKKLKVLIDAHSDEVGFMVQSINNDGTLNFVPLGGWPDHAASAQRVRVKNAKGEYIKGIISTTPPHFQKDEEKITLDNMQIDIGSRSKKETIDDFHIRIGEPIIPDVETIYDEEKDLLMGKAFDDRLGCAAVIGLMNYFQDKDLDIELIGSLSSQEEVGLRGAKVVAHQEKPDLAILFEGTPADDTIPGNTQVQTYFKKGPMIRHMDRSMISHPEFVRFALDIAEKENIPVQEAVRTGGGTNGGIIHNLGRSIPTIVIGVPTRYIHSHHGIASLYDFNASIDLAKAIISNIDKDFFNSL